jgi:hypothetical protein
MTASENNVAELVVSLCGMAIGTFGYAYMIGLINSSLARKDDYSESINSKINAIENFSKKHDSIRNKRTGNANITTEDKIKHHLE